MTADLEKEPGTRVAEVDLESDRREKPKSGFPVVLRDSGEDGLDVEATRQCGRGSRKRHEHSRYRSVQETLRLCTAPCLVEEPA
jgi:hypothetical protein